MSRSSNNKNSKDQSGSNPNSGPDVGAKRPASDGKRDMQEQNALMKPNVTLNRANRLGTPTEDEQLLRKPEPTPADFTRSDTWRVLRIMGEFVNGFDTLAEVGAAVT